MRNKICLVLISLILLSGCTLTPSPAYKPVGVYQAQAKPLLAERRYSEALDILEAGVAASPHDTTLLLQIGQIYLAQHRWLLAEDAFNRALAREPEQVEATAGLAETLLNQGRAAEALRFWQRASALDPALPGVFTGLGRTHLAMFNFEAAEAAFAEQQRHTPDYEAAWYLAALTAPFDLDEARNHLLTIPNAGPTGQADVSEGLQAQRDYLLATLVPFTEESPPAAVAQATGIAFAQIGLWPLAVHALQAALAQSPAAAEIAETTAFLAHALAQAGKPALDLFETARQADPDSALPLYFEGLYLRQQGTLSAAEVKFGEALALDPENAAFYLEMARTKELQGSLSTAETWYLAAVEAATEKLPFQRALLKFYANRSYQMEEAGIPLAEELIAADETAAELHDLLGWMRFLSGAPDSGEAALRQALSLQPDLVSARYHLGRFYESNRQSASAKAEYQRVVDWDTSGMFRDQALVALRRLAGE